MKCKSPVFVKNVDGLVPCGQCLPCRFNRRRQWTFRLSLELMACDEGCWVTLTYNNEFEPKSYFDEEKGVFYEDVEEKGRGTLDPRDVRLFIMRLRKLMGSHRFRYFLCGEYGEKNGRPHYHVCLFGLGEHWKNTIKRAWCDPLSKRPLGNVDVGTLTQYSMQYTCGYVVKKLTKKGDEKLFGLYPEFSRFSQGMGRGSIEKIAKALNCKSADVYYMTHDDIPRSFTWNGKNWPMDRYVRSKVLEYLQRTEHAMEKGRERYAQEVQRMSVCAETALAGKGQAPSKGALLRFQYQAENAQSVLNAEKRALLFMKKKEKLL